MLASPFVRICLVVLAIGLLLPGFALAADPIAGSTSGTFVNPVPGSAVVSGVGTSTFLWGDPDGFGTGPNSLNFAGLPFSTVTETPFQLGTLSYFNGTIAVGTEATSVDLKVTTNFTTPPAGAKSSTFGLQLIQTVNTGDPDASADYVNLPSVFSSTVFTIGSTKYTLKLTGFQNVIGDGFLTSTDTQFHVREGSRASAELWGTVTSDLTGVVPLPAAVWAGLGLLGMLAGVKFARKHV